MAKLDGITTVEMQDGEITKIAHYGVEYTKVDVDNARKGDICEVVKPWGKRCKGEFYYVSSISESFGKMYTHVEEGVNNNVANFNYFRKLAQPAKVSQPFAEMITSKVYAVEKRVAALEDAKGIGDTAEFSVGDTVKALRDGEFDDVLAGEFGVVTDISDNWTWNIRVETHEKEFDYFRPQDLEAHTVVTPTSPKPTVGDIVVITGNTNGSRNKVGDIGVVIEDAYNDDYSSTVDVPQRPKIGRRLNFTLSIEMRHATDVEKAEYAKAVEQAEKDAVFTKAGRKPNEYRKGDIGRVTKTHCAPYKIGDIVEVESNYYDVEEPEAVTLSDGYTVDVEIVCFAEDRADMAKGGR